MAAKNFIQKLNKIRRKTLPNFGKIKFTPQAVDIISKLFLHPFCINLVDLKKFIKDKPVKLSTLSAYIITAFPNTISFYAQKHKKILLTSQDILECFAIDHSEGVAENKIEKIYSPAYALAHILTLGKVVNLHRQKNNLLADLEYQFSNKIIIFKNVFVPQDVVVKKGIKVFHHFGVIVDSAKNRELTILSKRLKNKQKGIEFLCEITRESKDLIDFGKAGLYDFDLTSYIIRESKNPGKKCYKFPRSSEFVTKIENKVWPMSLANNKKIPFLHPQK